MPRPWRGRPPPAQPETPRRGDSTRRGRLSFPSRPSPRRGPPHRDGTSRLWLTDGQRPWIRWPPTSVASATSLTPQRAPAPCHSIVSHSRDGRQDAARLAGVGLARPRLPPPHLCRRDPGRRLLSCRRSHALQSAHRHYTWSTPARQQHEARGCPFGCPPPAESRALELPHLTVAGRIVAIPTPRVQRARSTGAVTGLLINAVAVEMYHRRPSDPAPSTRAAAVLASSLARDAARHLLPLRMRPLALAHAPS